MASSDLSADISFERLPPASSVRPVPNHGSKKDAESKSRRRQVPDESGAADSTADSNDDPEHQIDSLA